MKGQKVKETRIPMRVSFKVTRVQIYRETKEVRYGVG